MAYIYNEGTGEFVDTSHGDAPSGAPTPPTPPSNGKWKKWLKIAGKVAVPVLSVVLVAVTGIPIPGHD